MRCWSMDAERRKTAARLADYLVDCGVTDVGFHDTDTGGFDNPAQWEHRCDVCRRRWGDDYAAATVNKFGIYREEIKKRIPDVRLHFTFYPYNISAMTQQGAEDYLTDRYGPDPGVTARAEALTENFTAFWKGISAGMPLDVTFCIRENVIENVRTFFDTTKPHGVFTWYKAGSEQWMPFFDETPRFVPTFWSGHEDMLYTVSMNTFLPIKALAVREYAWNVNTPGASHWRRLPTREQHHADPKGAIYEVVLPHVVRNVFGRRAAPEIVEALSCNVAPNQVFDAGYRMTPVLNTLDMMAWQVEEAARGVGAMDRLSKRFTTSGDRLGMTSYAQRRFVYLREAMHCCLWMAQVKVQNLQARESATEGQLEAARAAIAEGRRLIGAAREGMTTLVAQRPPDPFYNAPPVGNDYNRRWRLYTPVWGVDFDAQEGVLAQTEKELESLAAAGQLPEGMLDQLRRRPGLHVFPAQTPPVVDGDPGDAVWSKALAGEAFWRYPGFEGIARAHTHSQLLRHGQTLYLSMTCWMPGGAEVTAACTERDGEGIFSDEHVELFLWPKTGGSTYYQLAFNPKGAVADVRHIFQESPGGGTVTLRDGAWTAEGLVARTHIGDGVWTLEAAIPLASCKPDPWNGAWHANVARRFVEPTGEHEWSALMKPGGHSFHDATKFLPLLFSDVPSSPPLIEIAVAGLHTRTQTLDDRIATLVDFGLDVHSSRILHNVRLVAETLDGQGKTHYKQAIKQLDHLVYRWKAEQDFTIGFEREVSKGALKITLISDEITVGMPAGFGGWDGAGTTASLFTPPVPSRETGEILATPSLAGPVYLPGMVAIEDGRDERMLDRHRGTLEFWARPHWGGRHPCETRLPWAPVRTFVHAGILRRSHPSLLNQSCFAVQSDARVNTLHALACNGHYAGWIHDAGPAETVGWTGNGWRHVAFVWDARAVSDDQFRLYVNGRRAGHRVVREKPERMGDDPSVRLPEQAFALQLLALNSGRGRAEADVDELRISRTVRYTEDFEPSWTPFEADRNTVALFHFDGNLKGIGMTADGVVYEIEAVPGVLELN